MHRCCEGDPVRQLSPHKRCRDRHNVNSPGRPCTLQGGMTGTLLPTGGSSWQLQGKGVTWQAPGSCSWTADQAASDSTTCPPFAQAAMSSGSATASPPKSSLR